MKRSEMRNLIKNELLKTVGGDAAKYISEDILYIIEKAGMTPPYYISIEKASSGYGNDRYEEFIEYHYEWEPEDEDINL